ncbi:tetratricopeptide repeat protein [Streptomyces sp. NPDC059010]|uniref:tetratricopeptide repeat protein n=1 Tax=Streptomyces sp. NPDC059010 TaxID=3346695 RepID=UPI0036931CCC
MSRLSRAKKREQKRAVASAASVAMPIDVRVPVVGPGAGGASIGGVPVTAGPGEEIQQAVLTHLQRIALASGHPVHATIHDERIGYVVPLQVDADGSSRFTADPVRTAPPPTPAAPALPLEPTAPAAPASPPSPPSPAMPESSVTPPTPLPFPPAADETPYRDKPTHVLRPLPGQSQDASPTFQLRALPEPVQDAVPGTVAPPLGEFGPPPVMDARPLPVDVPQTDVPQTDVRQTDAPQVDVWPADAPRADVPPADTRQPAAQVPGRAPAPTPHRHPDRNPAPATRRHPDPGFVPLSNPESDPDPKPTPPRGFDAVAEAVLGDAPPITAADASPFAEQLARVNEAVKAGRTTEAGEVADRTVAEASAVLGLEHAEVLRMRELAAYIAYLTGEPVRAFRLCLDVARTHHRTRDAEAAYGSLHGAATAWRAVRDPALGLDLGRELLGLWSELMAEGGPAVEDIEELESARARMDRLAARAAKSAEPPRS